MKRKVLQIGYHVCNTDKWGLLLGRNSGNAGGYRDSAQRLRVGLVRNAPVHIHIIGDTQLVSALLMVSAVLWYGFSLEPLH